MLRCTREFEKPVRRQHVGLFVCQKFKEFLWRITNSPNAVPPARFPNAQVQPSIQEGGI